MSEFEQRSGQALGGFYLTLVSIMQSLALGYLLQVVGSELIETETLRFDLALQAAALLLIIILVWHEYAFGSVVYTWRIDIFDSAIPFFIGITEALMLGAMSIPNKKRLFGLDGFTLWLWTLVLFAFSGIVARINQLKKGQKNAGAEPSVTRAFLRASKTSIAFNAVYIVLFLFFASFASARILSTQLRYVMNITVLVAFVFEMWRMQKGYEDVQRNSP